MSDFKINPALCFTPEDLTKFMRYNAESTNPIDNSTTHEIATALIYRITFEKELGWKDYFIYFEPKEGKQKELLDSIGTTLHTKDFIEFLTKNSEQYTLYDVYFVRKNKNEDADVRPVQIKRFGKGSSRKNLAYQLIDYLENKIMKKYPKNKGTLLIYMENAGELDPEPVIHWLNKQEFNFEEVCVCALRDDRSAWILQLIPNTGVAGLVTGTKEEVFLV
ncbi:MAG: hypothetical protein Q7T74_03250 [Candidatus Saccharibacteria bacterium]|nr:hypothetical protein [Candidatus Saccharibacteria bacterium]